MQTKKRNIALEYCNAYKEKVRPIFRQFEPYRQKLFEEYKKQLRLRYWLPGVIFVISIILFITYINNYDDDYSYIISALTAIASFLYLLYGLCIFPKFKSKYSHKFTNTLKSNALPKLLQVFGDIKWVGHDASQESEISSYQLPENVLEELKKENIDDEIINEILDDSKKSAKYTIKDSELDKSGLFVNYNTRYTDDEFSGTYKDVHFKISETKMYDIHGSGKNRTCICAFEGVILSFHFNKQINARTVVATKGDFTKKNQALCNTLIYGGCFINLFKDGYSHTKLITLCIIFLGIYLVSKFLEKTSSEEALEEVMLEDPRFSNRFNVYSSDQVEARYLVTPAFMKKFYNLKTAFGAKKLKCSFIGNTLMIAITTKKNLFEIGSLNTSLDNQQSIKEFYNELSSVFRIIDYLKLNEKLCISD